MQYAHLRSWDGQKAATLAVVMPEKNEVEQLFLHHNPEMEVPIGFTRKSKKDSFVKKIGREEAQKRMMGQLVVIDKVEIYDNKHVYRVRTSIPHNRKFYNISLFFRTSSTSNQIKLAGAYCVDFE